MRGRSWSCYPRTFRAGTRTASSGNGPGLARRIPTPYTGHDDANIERDVDPGRPQEWKAGERRWTCTQRWNLTQPETYHRVHASPSLVLPAAPPARAVVN